jgi:apolipoprotein N-acyltransferase
VEGNTQLVVWPETATPFYFLAHPDMSMRLIRGVRSMDTPLLFGSPAYGYEGGELRHYNRAYLLDGRGTVSGYYDKVHLVPFGEYVPWKRMLFFVNTLVEAAGDFASGKQATPLELDPARIGVLICYEGIFPELSRSVVRAGANILVNITNDAWFGRSSAPYQHFSMAVLRTVEQRVPMVRCANTGVSSLIDKRGCIVDTTRLFEETAVSGTLHLGGEQTVYCRFGDWFAWSCLAVAVFGCACSLGRKRGA